MLVVGMVLFLLGFGGSSLVDNDILHLHTNNGKEVNIKWKRSLTVVNASPPGSMQNIGPVVNGANFVKSEALADVLPDDASSGMVIRNGRVGSQMNFALESRKKREITEHITTSAKEVKISKTNASTVDKGSMNKTDVTHMKPLTQNVDTSRVATDRMEWRDNSN